MQDEFDVLIVGGGMVGASLALALRGLPLRVAVAEAAPVDVPHPSFDARAIALSQGSKRIFEALGVWDSFVREGTTPIRHIHVSDRGRFGAARLSAEQEGVEALGYVAEAAVMGRVLESALATATNAAVLRPAELDGLVVNAAGAVVRLRTPEGARELRARLIVAADGGRSAVRQLLGERSLRRGYGQHAVIAYVTTDRAHGNVAYERFTDSGPLAMLPCDGANEAPGDRRWSLVWTVRDDQLDEILGLGDAEFLARLQARLGHRAGLLTAVSPRASYPLGLHYVRDHARERVVFIGNAAHTIHPVGGQGFNLGLRDVAALAEVLAEAVTTGEDPGARAAMQRYEVWRRSDYLRVLAFTDGLARTFSSTFGPLAAARDVGLVAMDLLPPAKRLFARQAMGLLGRLPRLARGLALA